MVYYGEIVNYPSLEARKGLAVKLNRSSHQAIIAVAIAIHIVGRFTGNIFIMFFVPFVLFGSFDK